MVLHKQVNGKRIQLSEAEEKQVRAEWAKNDVIHKKESEINALLAQIPSIEDRLMAIETALLGSAFGMSDKHREIMSACRDAQPLIDKHKADLQKLEAENVSKK